MDKETTVATAAKIGGVWTMVGITSWSEAASFAAFIYTSWLIGQKAWKEVIKPAMQRRGWIK